jgi:hypothetical protein
MCRKKEHTIAAPKFSHSKGRKINIAVHALYGLKPSGAV